MTAAKMVTRGMVFTLDPSPTEERVLWSYSGAARKAHNWVIAQVKDNLAVRKMERAAGVAEDRLTPALSWSARSLSKRWNAAKEVEAPWWRASFQVRHRQAPPPRPARRLGPLVGVDVGLRHLATLSEPVAGLTDDDGHVSNPAVLDRELGRLRKLDRQLAKAKRGSKSHRRALRRRARLHGRISQTRALHLHRLSTFLAGAFDVVAVEDLNLAGMANRKRHLGRRLADAGLGELCRQLDYKTTDRGHRVVAVGRFYPSSKTCSACGAAKTKLPLWERIFTCEDCGLVLDRDVNAARNIAKEATRLLGASDQHDQQDAAGLRPETENAAPRPRKTTEAQAEEAGLPEGGTEGPPDGRWRRDTRTGRWQRRPERQAGTPGNPPCVTPICRT